MNREVIAIGKNQAQPVLQTRQLGKIYPNGVKALDGVSMTLRRSDFLVIIGSSGAGKSTLLRCLNRLIRPSFGTVELLGEDITRTDGVRLHRIRSKVGMIFQQFHLVRRLSVLENVLSGRLRFQQSPTRRSLSLLRWFTRSEKEIAFECLKQVGIADLAFQRADTLSGGQQQRVAIARALAQEPEVVLADEPIASLDPRSADTVLSTLRDIHRRHGIPVIVNLHHIDFARRYAGSVMAMKQGRIVFTGDPSELTDEVLMEVYGSKAVEEVERDCVCAC